MKDGFHDYLIRGNKGAVNPEHTGTKMAAHYALHLAPGESATLKLRLTDLDPLGGMDPDSRVYSARFPGRATLNAPRGAGNK